MCATSLIVPHEAIQLRGRDPVAPRGSLRSAPSRTKNVAYLLGMNFAMSRPDQGATARVRSPQTPFSGHQDVPQTLMV